jgi:hypothetical protein
MDEVTTDSEELTLTSGTARYHLGVGDGVVSVVVLRGLPHE